MLAPSKVLRSHRGRRFSEHLDRGDDRAAASADYFGFRSWGCCAGLWHDLGKYAAKFQGKLDGKQIQFELNTPVLAQLVPLDKTKSEDYLPHLRLQPIMPGLPTTSPVNRDFRNH